jgi:general secretion pathway protein L
VAGRIRFGYFFKGIVLQESQSRFQSALGQVRIGAFMGWWGRGLLLCLPASMRRLFSGTKTQLIFEVTEHEVVVLRTQGENIEELGRYALERLTAGESLDQVRALRNRADTIVLRLPPGQILSKSISLPLAAEANLRQVVAFEMDRLTPFAAGQVYFDVNIVERQSALRRLQVNLAATPRARVDQFIDRLAEVGFVPDCVGAKNIDPAMNLLPPEQRPRKSRGIQRLNWALVVLAGLLMGAAGALPVWQQKQLVDELSPQVNAAQKQAEEMLDLRTELEEMSKSSRFLLEKRLYTPLVIDLVDDLTRILPDGAWVEQLEVKSGQVRIRGQAEEASALIGQVEASRFFQGATFISPVTSDRRTGKDRFYLSAQIARGSDDHEANDS